MAREPQTSPPKSLTYWEQVRSWVAIGISSSSVAVLVAIGYFMSRQPSTVDTLLLTQMRDVHVAVSTIRQTQQEQVQRQQNALRDIGKLQLSEQRQSRMQAEIWDALTRLSRQTGVVLPDRLPQEDPEYQEPQ